MKLLFLHFRLDNSVGVTAYTEINKRVCAAGISAGWREIKRFHASNVEFFGWMGIQRHMGNQLGYYRGRGVLRPHRLRATGDRLDRETSHACFLSADACALCDPVGPPRLKGEEKEMETGRAEFE